MRVFLLNGLLALTWAALSGSMTLESLSFGFLLGYLVLLYIRRVGRPSGYFLKVLQLIRFCLWFIWELFLANLRVAYDVVTPTHHMRPGVVGVPLDARSEVEITLLANLISLTPGSLSLDLSPDRKVLYVHAMYIRDREHFVRSLKEGMERRLLQVLR